MKRNSYTLSFAALCICICMACSTSNYNEREIVGRWFSQEWTRNGEETGMTAWFDFMEDKTYRAVIARTQEQGTWWIDGYKLYTQAEGEEKIVVKIERLDQGVLELGMNRGGQPEKILLYRGN